MVRDDQLVQVHHHQVLDLLHVPDNDGEGLRKPGFSSPVQTVVQGSKEALSPDLLLGVHVQLPGQEDHDTLLDVVREKAAHLVTDRVIVQSEPTRRNYRVTTTLGQIDFQWNHLKYLVLDDFSLNASIVNLEHVQKSHKQISKENCHLISYLDVERYIRIQINGCWKYQGQAGGTLKRNLNVKRNMMWSSAGE